MRFFKEKIRRLVIIGMNDLACEAVVFCKKNDIEVYVISGQRFRDLPSLEDGFATCYERMESEGVNVIEHSQINRQLLEEYYCDDCAVFSFDSPFIIKHDIIDLFKGVVFNEHGARLPHGKGGGGFSWRIMEDDHEGNVLFHILVEEIDAGPIVYQKPFIFPDDCKKPVDFILFQHEKSLQGLREFLISLNANHDFDVVEQDKQFESYMPRLHTATQAFIDWSWSVEYVYRYILAFSTPYEGAKTFINGKNIYIYDAYVDKTIIHTHPYKFGIIFSIDAHKLKVICESGTLVITSYKVENDYRPQLGDRLNTPISVMDGIYSSRVIYNADGLKENKF